MASTTRQAAWRNGAANGWHDDLVWYAAAIHRMRALTPGLDDFLQIYLEAVTGSRPATVGPGARGDRAAVGRPARASGTSRRCTAPSWRSRQLARRAGLRCGRSARTTTGSSCRGTAPTCWSSRPWCASTSGSSAGRPPTGRCPYWNYTDHAADPRRLALPLPLQGETLPAGVTVPGVDGGRRRHVPQPAVQPDPAGPATRRARTTLGERDRRRCCARTTPTSRTPGRVSFGGGVLEDPNNAALFHDASTEIGQLDAQPHGSTHVEVGGTMARSRRPRSTRSSGCTTATSTGSGRPTPDDLGHGYPFATGSGTGTAAAHVMDRPGSSASVRPDASTDVEGARRARHQGLGYAYDTTAPPPLPAVPPATAARLGGRPVRARRRACPSRSRRRVRCRLSRDLEFVLSGGAGGDQGLGVDAFPEGSQWLLRFDGIRSTGPARTSYQVFLGLGRGRGRRRRRGHYAGLLSLFGVYEASRDDGSSAGGRAASPARRHRAGGAQAATSGRWRRRVRLQPRRTRDATSPGARLSIERITLEFA